MLHSNNPIIKHKTGLLNLAEELGNVSQAFRVMGVSRDTARNKTRPKGDKFNAYSLIFFSPCSYLASSNI